MVCGINMSGLIQSQMDGMMMEIKKTLIAAAITISIFSAPQVLALDFHGYVRSGISSSTNGDQQVWAAGKLGRLGNETDGDWIVMLSQELYKDDQGHSFSVYSKFEGDPALKKETEWDGNWGMDDFYITAKGYMAFDPGSTIWVGKRGFGSREIQMLDYKILRTSGNGAGIEDVSLGKGYLAASVIRQDADIYDADTTDTTTISSSNDYNVNMFDIRYGKLPISSNSQLELVGDYFIANKTDAQDVLEDEDYVYAADNSARMTGIITTKLDTGSNQFSLQAANKNLAGNYANVRGRPSLYLTNADNQDAYGWRITNAGEFMLSQNVIFEHAIAYAEAYKTAAVSDVYYDSAKSFNIVGRPAYIWSKNHKTALELGWYTQTNKLAGESYQESGKKVTLAHILSPGISMMNVRPEIRFYTSYLKVDKNEIDQFLFNDSKNHQISFGVQAEAWW